MIMNSPLDNYIAYMHSLLATAAAAKTDSGAEASDFVSFAVAAYKNELKTFEVDADLTSKIFEVFLYKEIRENKEGSVYLEALIDFQTEYLHNFEKVKAVFRESFNEKIISALAAEKVGAA